MKLKWTSHCEFIHNFISKCSSLNQVISNEKKRNVLSSVLLLLLMLLSMLQSVCVCFHVWCSAQFDSPYCFIFFIPTTCLNKRATSYSAILRHYLCVYSSTNSTRKQDTHFINIINFSIVINLMVKFVVVAQQIHCE